MRSRIVVTGASGTVGAHVARVLCDRGARVVAVVRTQDEVDAVPAECAEIRVADLRDDHQAREALDGADKVFMVTPATPDQVEIGDEIVAAATDAGVVHIVKLSLMGADAKPGTILGRWHRHMEKSIESVGLRATFLRANGFMQNFAGDWGRTIATEGSFALPAGNAAVSYVDARDVAEAGAETLLGDGHDGVAYTLTGAAALTHVEIAETLGRVLGHPVAYLDVSEDDMRRRLEDQGVPEPIVTGALEIWALQRAGGGSLVTTDLEEITGRSPTSFEQFARDHAAAWREPAK
jgi:uncharacterized protein YbjT (DUF2867 family)